MAGPADIFMRGGGVPGDILSRLSLDDLLQTVMREGQSVIASDPSAPLPPPATMEAARASSRSSPELLATEAHFLSRNPDLLRSFLPTGNDISRDANPMPGVTMRSGDVAPIREENIAPTTRAGTEYAPPAAAPAPQARSPAASSLTAAGPAPERGMLDQLSTFLAGLKGGDGALLPALGAGARAVSGENATARFLASRGLNQDQINAAIGNPAIMQQLLTSLFKPNTFDLAQGHRRFRQNPDGTTTEIASAAERLIPFQEGGGLYDPNTRQTVVEPRAKAPSGFEWVDPNDRSRGLRAIAGGPGEHLPSEVAGRLALMRNSRDGIRRARETYERSWGAGDFARQGAANIPFVGDLAVASGDQGTAQRDIRTAVEATLRAMTGAAAPETEVTRYASMFTPGARDTVQSAKQKLDALDNFIAEAERLITQGRTANPQGAGAGQGGAGWVDLGGGVRIRERR